MSGLCLGSCMPNFKFATFAILELLAFYAQKIKSHMTLTPPPFCEFFSGVMSGLYLGSCTPNFKFATLAILKLLAFNAPKINGHVTLTAPPFREFFQGSCPDFGSRRLCQIWSKSVKNCDRERARTHTHVRRTSDTRHRTRQVILYSVQCCYT